MNHLTKFLILLELTVVPAWAIYLYLGSVPMSWGLWILLFVFYTFLFFIGQFKAKEYIFMLCFNTFFLFVLLAFPRLKEFDAGSLSMKLDQIHQEHEEILAKEKDLKEIAQHLLDIDGMISLQEGRMGNYDLRREWVEAKLLDLKQKVDLDTARLDKYQKLFAVIDANADDASRSDNPRFKEANGIMEKVGEEIDLMMRQDIENARKNQ